MNTAALNDQVEIIRQAFGYINQFKDKTFVIKIDSGLITHDSFPVLIKDLVLLHQMGIRIVLVPGASSRIDEILKKFGIRSRIVKGVRISSPESIPFIKMAAFDVSNKVMTQLAENNTNAVIGNWVKARGIGVKNGIDYQSSGVVERLKIEVVQNILDDGMVPIFPNIGWNAKGKPYNISSNELALTIARELKAAKLFFITEMNGIPAKGLKIPKGVFVTLDGTVSQLTLSEAEEFLSNNPSQTSQREYEFVLLACAACKAGVERVHVINGRGEGMLLKEIFSNRGFGTMIYSGQHGNIRPAQFTDIPEMLHVMRPFVDAGILIERSAEYLEDNLEHFSVYDVDGTVHACGALLSYAGKCAEIAALAVDTTYASLGIGKKMVSYFLDTAGNRGMNRVFVLTTQTSDWFSELGFQPGKVVDLPAEKRLRYNKKRNSRILVHRMQS
jgi:amino-acid N-acetyltransferase